MNIAATNELIKTLNALAVEVHETRLKIESLTLAMKMANPDLYQQYERTLEGYRKANRAHSESLAADTAFDTLRSALRQGQ